MNLDRITTPFGFSTTADEVLKGVDLSGKRMLVTGGASGIGLETTKALAKAGAEVIVASRNAEVRFPSERRTDLQNITFMHLNLSDLTNVQSFCENFDGPLHALINNAGIMALPKRELTPQGWEMQFGVNHIGHFHLSLGLLKNLKQAKGARVVSVSSQAHSFAPVDFDDINFDVRTYDPILAYCQSKTANALFAVGAAKRWAEFDVFVNAVTPGAIRTDIQKHTGGFTAPIPEELIKTPQQGAATTVFVAAGLPARRFERSEEPTGRYFANCNEGIPSNVRLDDMTGVLPFAMDEELADRLWDVSSNTN